MAKAAPLTELQELHGLIAKSLSKRITEDMDDGIPTDAATLGAAIKFLKDNNVTADPADAENLGDLRDKLIEQSKQRKSKAKNVLALVQGDLQVREA